MGDTESEDIHELRLGIMELKGHVNLIKQTLESQKAQHEETTKSQKSLTIAINGLINTIATENGRKEGVRTTVKVIWGFVGSLIIALIITGSSLIISMKSEIDVLQNEIEHLVKKGK